MSRQELKLRANHTWKCKPGNSLCVLERGLVRFEYPKDWIVELAEGAVMLHDQPASVESCDLGVSIFPVPAEQIRDMPLDQTLLASLDRKREPYHQSEIRFSASADRDLAWIEQHYVEPQYKRDARFRVALVRGPLFCLISMNYWAARASKLEPVWDELLSTLTFGETVADPTAGPVVN